MAPGKVTLDSLLAQKKAGRKFPVLTCYDYPTAAIMAETGIGVLLVGDTVAEVVLGYPDTRSVSMDFMIEVAAAVRRGAPDAFVIGDMPFSSGYDESPEAAVRSARRFIDEAGCDIVKLEMSPRHIGALEAIRAAGVGVMAHIGLRPQWLEEHGGYKGQGRTAAAALELIAEARRMEEAGASMLLLEAVASEVSAEIAARSRVPVVGCVAGPACDGTVVVLHDMLGWGGGHPPRSVRRYADLRTVLRAAFLEYGEDVRSGRFPASEHCIRMLPGQAEELRRRLAAS